MRGRPYYEEPEYHHYLLSRDRKELFPHTLLDQVSWEGLDNVLDFGMGNGYFLPPIMKRLPEGAFLWGAECQEILIDQALQRKVRENISNFIPFYIERTEHPLMPDWIPPMDMILCSCVLSTFADPSLAIQGIARALGRAGFIILLDWEKMEAPSGPEADQKVSLDRMKYFIEDAGFEVNRMLKTNPFVYGMEIRPKFETKHDRTPSYKGLE
ncbi:MAG: class I SAM-dependent methyltransferase [Leptospirales bacterium]|jgi:SAM-dependent methyltransferase|nr:class I SAM-dependent methyltransferase [Leptospirales bacterium]